MSKGFVKSIESTYIDANGQEGVKTVTKEFVHKATESEPFYMVFIDYVKWMYNVKSATTIKILHQLMEMADFNTGEVSLSPGKRKEIMNQFNISRSSFTQSLNYLIEQNILQQKFYVDKNTGELTNEEVKGEYRINPDMFWKGDLKKRKELRVTFEAIDE